MCRGTAARLVTRLAVLIGSVPATFMMSRVRPILERVPIQKTMHGCSRDLCARSVEAILGVGNGSSSLRERVHTGLSRGRLQSENYAITPFGGSFTEITSDKEDPMQAAIYARRWSSRTLM